MVVELKGSEADLDKPQNRANDKRTPVDQAFDYAQHTGDIDWILVSNYNEFRLYNWHTKGKYISFTSEELLEKDVFSYFMLSFSQYSHISSSICRQINPGNHFSREKTGKELLQIIPRNPVNVTKRD